MINNANESDKLLIVTTLALIGAGLLMVYSTSYIMASERFGDEYFFVKRHLAYLLGGIVMFLVARRVPYTIYRDLAYPILLLSMVLLVFIYAPGFGYEAGGARRWVKFGPLTFQPSEPAKLAVVVFLAHSLSSRGENLKTFTLGFLPNMIIPGIVIAMIMGEPDFGTAMTLAILVFLMNFMAGVRARYLFGSLLFVVPALVLFVQSYPYMMKRIAIFLDPWKDPTGSGWQMVQSFLAFGSGGIYGVGLGEGQQKLFYLPEAHTDFILSVIGEELGLIGVVIIILLYIGFLISGIRVALHARDEFGTFLVLGITTLTVLQATLNMGVVLGLLPPKGLTLPFLSYGGTSLIVSLASVGVMLNVYIKSNEG